MARIDVLPSIEIIRGFKGILDFYVWRGLPCVRAWPKYRPAKQTAPSLDAALLFGAIVKAYSLLAEAALEAYRDDAADHNRTARDIMVSGVYGNLHEATMSDFLDALIICRDSLVALTALVDALHSIDTDEIVVRTEHSVLPDDASTAAAQASQLTALQKIDDLHDALESNALDRLLVRGMDQLFSIADTVALRFAGAISGANGFFDSGPVPAGKLWILTNIVAYNTTTATTRQRYYQDHGVTEAMFYSEERAIAANSPTVWSGHLFLVPDDFIHVDFLGGLGGDAIRIILTGYRMTLET